jgi:predicted neutral ceramidase superfamily lipid hydrolase
MRVFPRQALYNVISKLRIADIFSFETIFVLFLYAGRYKSDHRLEWIPVDLTAAFFVLSVIIGIVLLIRSKLIIQKDALILIILGTNFAIYSVISLLWTPGQVYAYQKAFYIMTLTMLPLYACALIIGNEEKRFNRFLFMLTAFSVWFALEVTILHIKNPNSYFISVMGGDYLAAGRTIGFGLLIIIGYACFTEKLWIKMLLGCISIFFLYINLTP